MSSKAHADRLARALEATGLVQTVETSFRPDQVSVIFRVLAGAEAGWLKVVALLKRAERDQDDQVPGWRIDISKPYLLKNDKLVFGWRASLQSQDLSGTLDLLNKALKGEAPARQGEISEMAFTGFEGQQDRNVPQPGSKKGAYKGETVPIDRR